MFNIFVIQSFQFLLFPETSFIHSFIHCTFIKSTQGSTNWLDTKFITQLYRNAQYTYCKWQGFLNFRYDRIEKKKKKTHISKNHSTNAKDIKRIGIPLWQGVKWTLKSVKKFKTLLYAAVGTASYQQWLQQVLCGGSGAGEKKQSCTYLVCTKLAGNRISWLSFDTFAYILYVHITEMCSFCFGQIKTGWFRREVNILGSDNIGHCEEKKSKWTCV